MAEIRTEESQLQVDEVSLYTKTWIPPLSARARLVFIHGFSDHCNSFYPFFFTILAQQGIKVYAIDQRGWGRSVTSPAQKGLTGPTSTVMHDITLFLEHVLPKETAPLFLMGHSMGGQEVLYYAATGPRETARRIRGFLVESPFIGLHPSSRPTQVVVVLGRLAGRWFPHRQMVQKLDPRKLSRDPNVCKEWEEDRLCHDTGTLEGMAGMLDRAAELERGNAVLKEGTGEGGRTRLWIGHGTADSVCWFDAAKKFYDGVQVEDKEFRAYEGWFHKLHAEPGQDKVTFANDVAKWILDRSGDDNDEGAAEPKPKL